MVRLLPILLRLSVTLVPFYCQGSFKTHSMKVADQTINITHWNSDETQQHLHSKSDSTIILLSGPTDNWNSDSAWFARLAPKLAKKHRVISIDRPGQILASKHAKVGYTNFGSILDQTLQQLQIKKIKILSFASANLALNQYLSQTPKQTIEAIIMIDPDVLLSYSISRYKKDAQPFKNNLLEYITYIESGKYAKRAIQKNTSERSHLKALSNGDQDTEWNYVDKVFATRLNKNNLINLFKEIAVYHKDLNQAFKQAFPSDIPLVIIDTDFEQAYIDQSDDPVLKEGLRQWKSEATQYYKQLVGKSVKGRYIQLTTREHLVPFSQPELLFELLDN